MNLFRKSAKDVPQTKAAVAVNAAALKDDGMLLVSGQAQLDGALAVYRRLYRARMEGLEAEEVRVEAVAWARASALMHLEFMLMLARNPPATSTMSKADRDGTVLSMTALLQTGWSLLLLAEDEVVEDALVTPERLDEMLHDHADWRAVQAVKIGQLIKDSELSGPPLRHKPQFLPVPDLPGGQDGMRLLVEGHTGDDEETLDDATEIVANETHHGVPELVSRSSPRALAWFVMGSSQWDLVAGTALLNSAALASDLYARRALDGPSAELDGLALRGAADVAVALGWIFGEPFFGAIVDSQKTSMENVALVALPKIWATLLALTARDDAQADSLARTPESLSRALHDQGCRDFGSFVANDPEFLVNGLEQLVAARADGTDEEVVLAQAVKLVMDHVEPGGSGDEHGGDEHGGHESDSDGDDA